MYVLGRAFGLDDVIGILVVEGSQAVVEEGMVVVGRTERVFLLFHLDDSVHW